MSIRSAIVISAGFISVAARSPDLPVDPGPPPPSLTAYKRAAEASVAADFFDPESAKFRWDRGIVGGFFKPFLEPKQIGWWTCGLVNGRNRMGGMVDFRRFVVVVRNEQVVYSAASDGKDFDFLTESCNQAIAKRIIPPAANELSATGLSSSVVPGQPTKPVFGIVYTAVPDGAYVATVPDGYPAAKAGLVAGMVIAKINGISLKGMGYATMVTVFDAASDEVTFDIIGRGPIKVTRAYPTLR